MSNIRVVDDSELMADMLATLLRHEGHGVTITTRDFADLLDGSPWVAVDAAIVDLHLNAEVTGFDVLAYLMSDHPQIRRIVLSGSSEEPNIAADARAFAHTVLPKPTGVEDILGALHE